MEYTFRPDQLDIFNILIDDASISLESIQNLKRVDNYVEFEIERRTFENVTRKRKLFRNVTYLKGKTSIVRIENVSDINVTGLTEKFMCNHFLVEAELNSEGELQIASAFGLIINLKTSSEFIIKLSDIKDSEFGKGTVGGQIGYTPEEWTRLLDEQGYTA
jgi:hypothetical protein